MIAAVITGALVAGCAIAFDLQRRAQRRKEARPVDHTEHDCFRRGCWRERL